MALMTEQVYEIPERDFFGDSISLEDQERFRQALDRFDFDTVGTIWGVGSVLTWIV